ncbi:MAG: Hpt domain-containing protein [Actinomycetales bacterium]
MTTAADDDGDLGSIVESLWREQLPAVRERVEVLRAFAGGREDLREEARRIAHKLAGGLGSYGRLRASELARDIEHGISGGIAGRELSALVEELDAAAL